MKRLAPDLVFSRLLPRPRRIERHDGGCALGCLRLECHVDDARVRAALDRWTASLPANASPAIPMYVAVERTGLHRDGYSLRAAEREVRLIGESPAGVFHGLQTLRQLLELGGGEAPCCMIQDEPDFAVRGLLHDVTRGKVPNLDTLKLLADRLAELKCNQLQLYIEHAFTFAFDPAICGPDDGLTPDEIHELDAYCKDRFIDLVPAVASLGHMGRILSMPRYQHLAEIEPPATWDKLSWPQRARGFTLDIANPESHRLVERIWGEFLDAFTSPVVNICGDEPWDLGQGKNKERFANGVGPAYIDHILRTHAICAARGRRTQVWSDVVCKHPELFHRLPRDLTVMHWGYDDKSDYEGTRRFVEAGLDTVVCPGTTGWKRILNAMNLAERNITTFARAGRRCGANGLINTDWGDHGHFNALACSWHAIALGAACAWDAEHPGGADFDERLAEGFLGNEDSSVVARLREVSRIADTCETWRVFWQSLEQGGNHGILPTIDEVEALADVARHCSSDLADATFRDSLDRRELTMACGMSGLFSEQLGYLHRKRPAPSLCPALSREFGDVWLARNKVSGWPDVLRVMDAVVGAIDSTIQSDCQSGSSFLPS